MDGRVRRLGGVAESACGRTDSASDWSDAGPARQPRGILAQDREGHVSDGVIILLIRDLSFIRREGSAVRDEIWKVGLSSHIANGRLIGSTPAFTKPV